MSATPGSPKEQNARSGRRSRPRPPLLIECPTEPTFRQPLRSLPDPADGGPWAPAVQDVWEDAWRGRLAQSISIAVRGACTAPGSDARWGTMWSVVAARLLLAAGQLGSARAAARCALHMPWTTAGSDLVKFAAADVLVRVAMATGDLPSLVDAAHDIALMTASPLGEVQAEGRWLRTMLHASVGAPSSDPGPLGALPIRPSSWFRAAPEVCDDVVLARLLSRGAQHAAAEALLAAAADRTTWQPHRIDVAATHHAVAGVVRQDPRTSLRAAWLFDRSGRPLAAAAAREDAAAALGTAGRDRGTELLAAAIRTYDRAGARADAARVRADLAGRGVYRVAPRAFRP